MEKKTDLCITPKKCLRVKCHSRAKHPSLSHADDTLLTNAHFISRIFLGEGLLTEKQAPGRGRHRGAARR